MSSEATTVELGNPRDAAATALLQASHALMQSLFPAESNHYLSVDALCTDDIRFFVAKVGGSVLGCGALALRDNYGEVKSMFVDPAARGSGLGIRLLKRIEEEAHKEDLPLLRLETGGKLHSAHKMYEGFGFIRRGPFGDYPDDPNSLFMEKPL